MRLAAVVRCAGFNRRGSSVLNHAPRGRPWLSEGEEDRQLNLRRDAAPGRGIPSELLTPVEEVAQVPGADLLQRADHQVGAGGAQLLLGVVPDEADGDALHA